MPNQARMAAVDVDHTDHTAPDTMVAPLQQELELMKKAAGVPNAFDSHDEEYCDACDRPADECGCEHEHGEPDHDMDALKYMAGIKIAR